MNPNTDTDKGSDKVFILTFLALVILAAIFIGGYYFYQKYKDDNNDTTTNVDDIDTRSEDEQDSDNSDSDGETTNNVFEVASEQDNLTKITEAIQSTGFDGTLQDLEQNFTLFLPIDSSLENVTLPEDSEELLNFVKTYAVSGSIAVDDLIKDEDVVLTNLNGDQVTVKVEGDLITINDIEIIKVNIEAANGVIYIINGTI